MNEILPGRSFRGLFDATVDPMLLTDVTGHIVLANASATELFGYSAAELSRLTVEELIPERLRSLHREYRGEFATRPRQRKMGGNLEIRGLRKDGSEFPADISLSPLDDGLVLATIHDISRRKEAERLLRESEERFRNLLELTPDGLLVNCGNRFVYVNRAAVRMLGASAPEQVLARSPLDLVHPDFHSLVRERMQALMRGESVPLIEEKFIRMDGSVMDVECSATPILDQGEPAWLVLFRDINERKRIEQELNSQRIELEQLLKLHVASQTAAAIAHELNQPLNAIASYNEAALRFLQAGNPKPERLLHAIESSAREVQRASAAIRHLVEFLHKGETVTEPVDLNQLVRDAVATFSVAGLNKFRITLAPAAQLRPVLANRLQIEKVLVNLLRNGVEAMQGAALRQGTITVAVSTANDGNHAQVTVRDSGPGLDAETLQRLYEPFYTTKPTGIGMGLAISRALVEAHGGTLWVETDAAPGASFHFTLPFAT